MSLLLALSETFDRSPWSLFRTKRGIWESLLGALGTFRQVNWHIPFTCLPETFDQSPWSPFLKGHLDISAGRFENFSTAHQVFSGMSLLLALSETFDQSPWSPFRTISGI
jgi:hypothetical protein